MAYERAVINEQISIAPLDFVQDCEKHYSQTISTTAEEIFKNRDRSAIVLLSGPSGSGKTTTAKRITAELKLHGINAYTVSLDNYFVTVDPQKAPRAPDGDIDYESPACLDLKLLGNHFSVLANGGEVQIPHFSFAQQQRIPERSTPMKLGKNDVVIIEGIHALNECITSEHTSAYKLYVSTLSDIVDQGAVIIKGSDLRLVRRLVRDDFFRGADPQMTLGMWDNIQRGEKLNIIPYKDSADRKIDSALPYEICVLRHYADELFKKVPENAEHFETLKEIVGAYRLFNKIDPSVVPPNSILREFIGGSAFKY